MPPTIWLGEAGLTAQGLSATGGYEILGADKGVALTSVQTPLASHFKFNGWAGKFGTTPPNGLRDLYGTLGYGWKKAAGFDSDRHDRRLAPLRQRPARPALWR
jgi:hypothetical protein